MLNMTEKFYVTFRASYGRVSQPRNFEARILFNETQYTLNYFRMYRLVLDDSFHYSIPSGLKLRLNQNDSLIVNNFIEHRQYQFQRDKRDITAGKTDSFREIRACQITGVRPVHHYDSLIIEKPPDHLAVTNVYSVDFRGTFREQNVSEAPC